MYAGRLLTWAWRYYRHMACGLGCIDPTDLFEWGSLEMAPPHVADSPLGPDAPKLPDPIFTDSPAARIRARLVDPRVCSAPGCKKSNAHEALQRCGSCRAEAYCSRDCQRKAWKTHKSTCALAKTRRRLLDGRDGIAEVARRLLTCYVSTVQSHRELAGWSTAEAERLLLLLTGKKAQSVERSSKARLQEIQAFPIDTAVHPLAHVMAAVCEGEYGAALGKAMSFFYQHPSNGAACVVLGALLQALPSYVPAGPRSREINAQSIFGRLRRLCFQAVQQKTAGQSAASAAAAEERARQAAANFTSSVAEELRTVTTSIPGTLGISIGAALCGFLMEALSSDIVKDVEGARTLYLATAPLLEEMLYTARPGATANYAEVGEPLLPTDAKAIMLDLAKRKDDSLRDGSAPPALVLRHASPLLALCLVRYAALAWVSAREMESSDLLLDTGRFLRIAAEITLPAGRTAFAYATALGRGMPSNPTAAYTQLMLAARDNDPDALFLLGLWRRAAAGNELLRHGPVPGQASEGEAQAAALAKEMEQVLSMDGGDPTAPDAVTATDEEHAAGRLGLRRSGGAAAGHSDDIDREQAARDVLPDGGAKPWLVAAAERGSSKREAMSTTASEKKKFQWRPYSEWTS